MATESEAQAQIPAVNHCPSHWLAHGQNGMRQGSGQQHRGPQKKAESAVCAVTSPQPRPASWYSCCQPVEWGGHLVLVLSSVMDTCCRAPCYDLRKGARRNQSDRVLTVPSKMKIWKASRGIHANGVFSTTAFLQQFSINHQSLV